MKEKQKQNNEKLTSELDVTHEQVSDSYMEGAVSEDTFNSDERNDRKAQNILGFFRGDFYIVLLQEVHIVLS